MPKNQSAVIRWGATALLAAAAVGLFVASNVVDARHEAEMDRQSGGITTAQERIALVETKAEALPAASSARALLTAANQTAQSVVRIQNAYGEHLGPLSLEGIPEGEKDVLGKIQPFSEEYRTELASAARVSALDELQRSSLSFFAPEDTDEDGPNAAASWTVELGLSEQASTLTWSSPEVLWFTENEDVRILWELRAEDETLLGWASATWSNKTKTMTDFALSTEGSGR